MAVRSPYINTANNGNMESGYDNLTYQTVEILLDDVAKQMASSNLSRYSRGSAGYKSGSGRLRTSSSPRSSNGIGRRRTVIADAGYRQRLGLDKPTSPSQTTLGSSLNNAYKRHTKAERPISWHTSAHFTPQVATNTYQQYPVMRDEATEEFPIFDMLPAPPVYSGYTSPISAFSPHCLPYTQPDQQFHYPDTTTSMSSNITYDMYQNSGLFDQTTTYIPPSTAEMVPGMYSTMDWSFPTTTYETSTTAPPTPQNFLPVQHPEPAFPSEESIPYQPLEDEDDSGEELIGMGLYDAPDHGKDLSTDPQLDNYRATMMSNLGAVFQRPEPRGKGLKLEETWNPPEEEEDEDADADGEEEDEDEDGEAEDDEDDTADQTEMVTTSQQPAEFTSTTTTNIPQFGENELRFLQGMSQ